jgi:predicted RNA methylase
MAMKQTGIIVVSMIALCFTAIAKANTAREILDAAGIKGGLIVHLGCGDGELTAALHADDSCVVQGLDADPRNVEAARKHIQSLRLYGKVSADLFDGKQLPYVDDCVNLIVASDGC